MPARSAAREGPELLVAYLKRKRMTQLRFAAESGIPQSEISAYCRDRKRPRDERRIRIEEATDRAVPAASWIRRREVGLLRQQAVEVAG